MAMVPGRKYTIKFYDGDKREVEDAIYEDTTGGQHIFLLPTGEIFGDEKGAEEEMQRLFISTHYFYSGLEEALKQVAVKSPPSK